MTITLTPAQVSALECSGLELEDLEPEMVTLRDAWIGKKLKVTTETRDALFRALTDRSNAEGDLDDDPLARGASLALGNLASKVLRAAL